MAATRVVLCLFTASVLAGTHAKPMFGSLMCSLFCEDYEDGLPSTTTSLEDLMDFMWDPCGNCPTDRPSRVTTTAAPPVGAPPGLPIGRNPYSFVFPPSAMGRNITVLPPISPNGGQVFQILPWVPATPAPAPAPEATTAAPAAATTAAGATAAPTTAAA